MPRHSSTAPGGHGRSSWSPRRLAAAALLLLALQPVFTQAAPPPPPPPATPPPPPPAAAPNATLPNDIDGLTQFKAAIDNSAVTVLNSWTANTDPCFGNWPGVICSCGQLFQSIVTCNVSATSDPSGFARVLGLYVGPQAAGQRLSGTIAPALGQLDALMYLDLSRNSLRGPIPSTLASLASLQWLVLSGNQLTGTLPAFLGSMPVLKGAQLQENQLNGSVPAAWCANNATYAVNNNPSLCGFLPSCIDPSWRITSTASTFLVPANVSLSASGGVCDTMPPLCSPDLCKIQAPAYWTTPGSIAFNFTAGCQDVDSGILKYQWGLGTGPGLADVLPMADYNSTFQPPQQTVKLQSNGDTTTVVLYQMVLNMSTLALREDQPYYITVAAVNKAGPRLSTNFTMGPVGVDTSPPRAGAVYNTYDYRQASATTNVRFLSASWDNFTDTHSDVVRYAVQFYQASNGSFLNITAPLDVGLSNRAQVQVVQLNDGFMYFAQITAYNGAGLMTSVQGQPITVNKELAGGMAATITAIIVVITSLACMVVGAAVAVLIMRGRVHQQRQREKERQQESKQLKALMYALTSTKDDASKNKDADSLRQTKEFAFVVTDIEDSTLLSHQDPGAFQQMQEIHDQIMREGIAKHSGYEIITEGDSFSIAFTSVQPAVQFCLECQYRLLETCWPKRVLKLSSCKPVTGPGGELIFQGPRVRMGVHWAKEGTVVHRLHNLTRHRIFAGPGMQIAQDVGETAHGGQVLVTQDAWTKLRENMGAASFPVVHLLGLYQLPALPSPIWIYDISEMVGKPLPRSFPPPRKIAQVWPRHGMKMPSSWGLHIMPPPRLSDRGSLTFVWARLTTFPQGVRSLPLTLQNKLEEVIAAQAQQFKGYMFSMDTYHGREGKFGLAFEQAMDAVRFAHAAQMQFMYTRWPPEAADFYGLSVPSPDGRWVFQGPRVAMALHESDDFQINAVEPDHPVSEEVVDFVGPATDFTLTLSRVARGGQVVLSERAWDAVKPVLNQHPGAAQVVSLGTHILNEEFPDPVLLMEVLPNLLARRNFKLPVTRRMLEPGYRDAPHPSEPMAIVFVKAAKPSEVVRAERIGVMGEGEEMCDDDVFAAITAFQVGVSMYCSCARRLLRAYDGYECKEPEPGKFTLAFRRLDAAVRWACHMQQELLAMPWPEELLRMEECAPLYGSSGELIWAGLRVRVGMAYGYVSSKKPLNTGRADYFGVLANMAARVSALAAPGQVMMEASVPATVDDGSLYPQLHDELPTYIPACWAGVPPPSNAPFHQQQLQQQQADQAALDKTTTDGYALNPGQVTPLQQGAELLELRPLGYFLLRGIDNPKLLFQATAPSLLGRDFALPTDSMVSAPSGQSLKASFGGSYSLKRYQLSWLSWMDKTKGSWMSKRTAPSSSGNSLPMYKRPGMAAAAAVDSPGLSMQPDSSHLHARNRLIQSMRKSKGGSISAGAHSSGDNLLDRGSSPTDLRQMSGISTHSAPGDPRFSGGAGSGSGLGSSLRLGSAPNMGAQADALVMSRLRLAPIQTAMSPGEPRDNWGAESSNTAQTPTTPMLDCSPMHNHSAGGGISHSRADSWGAAMGSEVSFSSRSYSPMHAFMNNSFSVQGDDKGKLSALRRPFQYLRISTGKQRNQAHDGYGSTSGAGMHPGGAGAAESPPVASPMAPSHVSNGHESQIPSRVASPGGYDMASPGAFAREVAYAYLHHKHNAASSTGSMSAASSPYVEPGAPTLDSSPSPPPRQPSMSRTMSDGGNLHRSSSGPPAASSAAALRLSSDSTAALQLLGGGQYGGNGTGVVGNGSSSNYIEECMAWRVASETAGHGKRGPRVQQQQQQQQQQAYYGGTQAAAGSGRLSSHPMAGNSGNGYFRPDDSAAGGAGMGLDGSVNNGFGALGPAGRVRAEADGVGTADDDSDYGDDETEEEHSSPSRAHMAADMDGRMGRTANRLQQGSQASSSYQSPSYEYQRHRQQQHQVHSRSHHGSPLMSPRHLQQLPPQQLPTPSRHRRTRSTEEPPTTGPASSSSPTAGQLALNPNPLTAERSPSAGNSPSPITTAAAAAAVLGPRSGFNSRRSRSASADDITFMGSPTAHHQQQLQRMATEAYPIDAGQIALAFQQQQQQQQQQQGGRAGLNQSPRGGIGPPGSSPRNTNPLMSPRGGTQGLPELPSPMWGRDAAGNRSTGRASPEPSLLGPMRGGSAVWAANTSNLSPRSLDSARSGGGGNGQYSPQYSPPGSGAYPSPRDMPLMASMRSEAGFMAAAGPPLLRGDAALLGRESPVSPRGDPLNATFPGSLRGPSAISGNGISGMSGAMMGGTSGMAAGYPFRNGRQWITQQMGGSRSPSSAGGRDSPRSLAGFVSEIRRGGSSGANHGGSSATPYSDDDDDGFGDAALMPDGMGRGPSMVSLDGHPNLGPMADIPEMRALEGRVSPPRGGRSGANSNRD